MRRTVRLAALALVATGLLATPAMAHPDPPCSVQLNPTIGYGQNGLPKTVSVNPTYTC